jgi:hypothetical protein
VGPGRCPDATDFQILIAVADVGPVGLWATPLRVVHKSTGLRARRIAACATAWREVSQLSTEVGSMLFAGKEKRGGMGEPVLRLLGIPSLRRPPGRKEI